MLTAAGMGPLPTSQADEAPVQRRQRLRQQLLEQVLAELVERDAVDVLRMDLNELFPPGQAPLLALFQLLISAQDQQPHVFDCPIAKGVQKISCVAHVIKLDLLSHHGDRNLPRQAPK